MLVGFSLLTLLITWPLAQHFSTFITAPLPGNDQLGYLFDFRYAAENGLPVIRDYVQSDVAVPFGRPASAAANLTLLGTLLPAITITKIAGPIIAYNIVNLSGLALSGASMYLLVRWLGLGVLPAIWAGGVYLAFPYHLLAATAFLTVVPYQALPLVLMGLVAWVARPGWTSAAGVVGAVALAWLTFPYIGAMAMVMVAVGLAVGLLLHGMRDGWMTAVRRAATVAAGIVAFVAAPLAIVAAINKGGATGSLTRSPGDLAQLGAEISDYVIPPVSSGFLAGIAGRDWATMGSVGGERLAFTGWVTLGLAVAGAIVAFAWRRSLAPRQFALLAIAVPMIAVLVAVSLRSPYDLWGGQVTFPSRALYEAFTFIRAPGRFVIAVMVGLCALGALALHLIGSRLSVTGRYALMAGAIVFSAAELGLGSVPLPLTPPTFLIGPNIPSEDQPTWRWLAAHPGGAVMEYPEVGNTSVDRYYMFGWTVHHHPIVNAVNGPGDPGGEFLRTVLDPRPVQVPAILSGAGVRYVVLNRWAYDALALRLPRLMPEGFTRVASFPDGSEIYRVDAAPSAGQVYFTPQGFDVQRLEWDGRHIVNWRYLLDDGVVRVRVPQAGTYRVRFDAMPLGAPVTLSLRSASGPPVTAPLGSRQDVDLAIALPAGSSDVHVDDGVAGPAVQMSPWVLEMAP